MSTPSNSKVPGPWRKRAAAAAYAGGLILLALTFWRGWLGQPFAVPHILYVEKPLPHLLGGLAGLLAGYILHRGQRNGARDWARLAGKCVMLLLSVGLSFVIGEIGYRALLIQAQQENSLSKLKEVQASGKPLKVHSGHPLAAIVQVSADPRVMYELQPNLDMGFGHKTLRTNSDGLREDRDYPTNHPAHGVRIIGVGDSGMFGWNCDQGQAYMDVLEQRLQARGNGVTYEVLNLAVPGYNTRLEAECLRVKGLKYRPDVVVVGWCINDGGDPLFVMHRGDLARRDISYLYTWMFARTNLMHIARDDVRDQRDQAKGGPKTKLSPEQAQGRVAKALGDIKRMQERQKFELLVFGPMDNYVIATCRELGIPYFNTLEKVDATKYPGEWAVHFMHPHSEGHRVLGEHLEKELDRLGWLKPRD